MKKVSVAIIIGLFLAACNDVAHRKQRKTSHNAGIVVEKDVLHHADMVSQEVAGSASGATPIK